MDKALYDRIAKVAYDLYEKKGRRNGCQEEDWLEAEKIVRAQLAKEAATKKAREPRAESQKITAKAGPQKVVARKAAAETGKKAGRPAAKTSASKKRIFPEATI